MNKRLVKCWLQILVIWFGTFLVFTSNADVISKPQEVNYLRAIIERGKLVVAMLKTDDPVFYEVNKEGELVGFDQDLAQDIAKELGVKLVLNRTAETYDQVVDLVVKDKADIAICNLSKTLDRAKKVLFTDIYATFYQTLIVNDLWFMRKVKDGIQNKNLPKAISDAHCVIGVITHSSYVGFANSLFPAAIIKTYPDWQKVIQALINGEIDAAFYDDFRVKLAFIRDPKMALNFRGIIFREHRDLISIVVHAQGEHLVDWLNHYLEVKKVNVDSGKLLEYAVEHNMVKVKFPGEKQSIKK